MKADLHFDYTTVGHVTADVLADGTRRPGGSAFYSALQAARLGARALIITQGVPHEIEALIEPYRHELHVQIAAAAQTTTLYTSGSGTSRTQRVLAWAGPMDAQPAVHSTVLHLAPVLRECPAEQLGFYRFLGLTPQGLLRTWSRHGAEQGSCGEHGAGAKDGVGAEDGAVHERDAGAEISLAAPGREWVELARRCHALVLSQHERAACATLINAAGEAGAIVALTAGGDPTTVLLGDRSVLELEVPHVEQPGNDLGAGDVFAAAFFIELAHGSPPHAAAAFANVAAAVRMRGAGAEAIGDRVAIAEWLRTLSR